MHLKSGTYYYVTTTTPRKWINLGKDIDAARNKWASIESGVTGEHSLSRYIDLWMESKEYDVLSPNTKKQYRSVVKQLSVVFADFNVQDIRPHHIAAWQDKHHSPVNANTGKSIIKTALNLAVRRGAIDVNHANAISAVKTTGRKRYITNEEYIAIRSHASPVLRAVMDLSYCTGSRVGDVLAIRLEHISKDGLLIRQGKTKALQLFQWNDAMKLAIDNAKAIPRPVRGLFLLCTMRGQQYQYQQINLWWVKAREDAGIDDVHFHDIRGKSATDAKRGGQDYQSLLGHTTKAMSDSYIKLEEAKIVEPLRNIL
jgi:integrase